MIPIPESLNLSESDFLKIGPDHITSDCMHHFMKSWTLTCSIISIPLTIMINVEFISCSSTINSLLPDSDFSSDWIALYNANQNNKSSDSQMCTTTQERLPNCPSSCTGQVVLRSKSTALSCLH